MPKLDPLCGTAVVEVEESAEALLAEDWPVVVHGASAWVDERVVETLVVPLLVVVLEELAENAAPLPAVSALEAPTS